MSLAEPSSNTGAGATHAGSRLQFAFVAASRPVISGAIGGLALLALAFLWARWTGRMHHVDAAFAGVVLGSVVVSTTVVVSGLWRSARRAAAMLGHLELDNDGIRWVRGDRSLGFHVLWQEVVRATVDPRHFTVLLFKGDGSPVLVGVLSGHGVPSGFVVPERFSDLVALVERRVPTAPHVGAKDPPAGRRVLLLGAIGCLHAAGLYAANLSLGELLHWRRLLVPMPLFVGAVSLLTLAAGARIRWGRGPLLSPMYGPGYRATMLRFLVVASLANVLLLGIANGLGR